MKKKVYSADLTHTGNGTMALTFPLGTAYVVSYAKKILGNYFDFKLFKYQDKMSKEILRDPPDILALSNYCWNIELGYTLINWAKKINPKLIVILGGPNFPTEVDEKKDFLKSRNLVDFYIESEGEVGFVKILEKLQKYNFDTDALKKAEEEIVNCCYLNGENLVQAKIERIKDVNILPSPYLDGTLDEFFDLPLIPMLETTRGCPFSCTFCADGLSFKNKIYSYEMQRVKEEIKYVCD